MLSPSQKNVEEAFVKFLQEPDETSMVISGFAGSGKTYLVEHLLKVMDSHNTLLQALEGKFSACLLFPFLTATTNKAANVLQDYLPHYSVGTIYSVLGLTVKNDYKTGKTYLVQKTEKRFPDNVVIFIDEAGMVDKPLLKFIEDNISNIKKVYIGDYYQLPPIGERGSLVFKSPNIHYLKEIQRQAANNPIIQLSQQYKDIIDQGTPFTWPKIVPDNTHIFKLTGSEFKDLIKVKYPNLHNVDNCKVLAYTNAKVIAYNKHIRSLNTTDPYFIKGEQVIVNSPIVRGDDVIFTTDSTVTITKIKVGTEPEYGIAGHYVTLNHKYTGFHASNHEEVRRLSKHAAKHKDWGTYFRLKELFIDIRSSYALTCHKAQGSTYDEVFIDLSDISKNKKWYEIARLVYVAITRAKYRVYFYGDLINKWE